MGNYMSITAMPQYEGKSMEELRWGCWLRVLSCCTHFRFAHFAASNAHRLRHQGNAVCCSLFAWAFGCWMLLFSRRSAASLHQ